MFRPAQGVIIRPYKKWLQFHKMYVYLAGSHSPCRWERTHPTQLPHKSRAQHTEDSAHLFLLTGATKPHTSRGGYVIAHSTTWEQPIPRRTQPSHLAEEQLTCLIPKEQTKWKNYAVYLYIYAHVLFATPTAAKTQKTQNVQKHIELDTSFYTPMHAGN
jgi:hypothetical protein